MKAQSDASTPRISEPVPSTQAADAIRVHRPFHAWLHFDVLSHVELGGSPSSVHDAERPWRPWISPLREAIRASERRVDRLALQTVNYTAMHRAAGDDTLGDALRHAWGVEYGRVSAAWQADDDYGERLERFWQQAAGLVTRCRMMLTPAEAPPLLLLDVPALARARSVDQDGVRVMAVDLRQAPAELVCRIVHEDARAHVARTTDTRYGAGYGLDGAAPPMTLDAATIKRAEQAFESAAPDLLNLYRRLRGQSPTHSTMTACD